MGFQVTQKVSILAAFNFSCKNLIKMDGVWNSFLKMDEFQGTYKAYLNGATRGWSD